MSAKFYTLLTDIGAAKLASATALGIPLKITHMAVGDGGGCAAHTQRTTDRVSC
ncbi:phage tail fiber protein [Salmonella enterica subsp. enterica]|uniref:Phage tail fiber protein n=1 Tax=Salmonella enterica I TaxID=59201 RepID=A0A379ZTQ1_SALET|nr:phage tail fiber protein [Salmonella enterica subsp. enterica]